jgi:prepilin-type N-terminal cleavage/methylation domain-containing protein/prepilin-type processing-associated H-X9-DG protein
MRRGFTLVELLVVIAIIAILAAILFPVFAKARDKAKVPSCASNLHQVALAIMMYVEDHDRFGPYNDCGNFVSKRVEAYSAARQTSTLWSCPSGGSYALHPYRGGKCRSSSCPSAPPWNYDYNNCGRVVHPSEVMLIADASTSIPPKAEPAGPNCFIDANGNGTARHLGVNNIAYLDGHVRGVTPGEMRRSLSTGDADADGDGQPDGKTTGDGAWYRWYY